MSQFKLCSNGASQFIAGSITDGTNKLEIVVSSSILVSIPLGRKVRVFGSVKKGIKFIFIRYFSIITCLIIFIIYFSWKYFVEGR